MVAAVHEGILYQKSQSKVQAVSIETFQQEKFISNAIKCNIYQHYGVKDLSIVLNFINDCLGLQ